MSAKNQNEVEDPFDDEEIDINTEDGIDVSTQSILFENTDLLSPILSKL